MRRAVAIYGATEEALSLVPMLEDIPSLEVAAIYDAVEAPTGRFVAVEYVFGESLRDLLGREGHLMPARAVEIASQILLALEYAHGLGITHRNLRPENVAEAIVFMATRTLDANALFLNIMATKMPFVGRG